jgi:ubiquinone biosynthesis protein UbiJ
MTSSPFPFPTSPLAAAAINHLLAAEPWAQRRLAAHAGKVACIDFGFAALRFAVAADGLLQQAPADAAPTVTIRLRAADLPLMAQQRERAFSYVKIEGDADFANAISQLVQNLRWDAEGDLARVVGDIAAVRLAAGARGAAEAVVAGGRKLAENTAEYLLEERPVLVRPLAVREFADAVTVLRNDLERLGKRVERLERAGANGAVGARRDGRS